MTTLDALRPGVSLGRYQCLMPIARGGMAAVWAARVKGARGFEKTVALKIMLPALSDDPNFTRMFLDEARINARIRHPNVAEVIDLGEEGELLYLVMEWIDGEPLSVVLREALRSDGVPVEVSARIVIDACAGLHAAHELCDNDGRSLGLVHRDVSPQNILLSTLGEVKIADFGIAKLTARASQETAPGQLRGKIDYMSPEQALDKRLDRRSDVFAMGTVLYQLVTGKHAFRGDSDLATLQNIVLRPPPPPRSIRPSISAALEAVILGALERDPERRFATAAELATALEDALEVDARAASVEAVAQFLETLVGERARKRTAAFRRAVSEADGGVSADGLEPTFIGGAVSSRWQIARTDRTPYRASTTLLRALGLADMRRGPRAATLVIGSALVLLVGIGLGALATRHPASPEASPAAGIDQPPESVAKAPSDRTVPETSAAAIDPTAEALPPPSAAAPRSTNANANANAKARTAPRPAATPARSSATKPRWSQPIPEPGF